MHREKESIPNEADGAGKDKEAIKVSNLNNLVNLWLGEHAAASEKVKEKGANSPIHIQHKIVRLAQSILLDLHCILHVLHGGEIRPCILLKQLHSLVSVVPALYPSPQNPKISKDTWIFHIE